jgi:lysozyme
MIASKNEQVEDIIKGYEGFRSKPYRCSAGKLTIGYGRNLDDVGIYKEEASELLENDISDARLDIMDIFGLEFWRSLSENRNHALTDLMFNLGKPKFLTFKKMIQAIKDEDWDRAADELLESKYANQVGQRAIDNSERLRHG